MLARTLNQKPLIGANFSSPPKSARERAVERWFLREKVSLTTTTTSDKTVPGQYFDSETNLHYNHFRYYDPTLGRYITSDPVGISVGLNTYSYVNQNPLTKYDPRGLVAWWWLAIPGALDWIGGVSAAAGTGNVIGNVIENFQAEEILREAIARAREVLKKCLEKKKECKLINCDLEEAEVDELNELYEKLRLEIIPLMRDLLNIGYDVGMSG